MYKVEFSIAAEKQFDKLDNSVQERIISVLERCRIRPYPHVKKLVNNQYFRLRAGDYRVIMDIKETELLILVIEVGHRKSIYKDI
jgi:mRNA interferase RelE/StbE